MSGVKATSLLIGAGVVMLALFAGVHQALRSEKDQKLTASSESKIITGTAGDYWNQPQLKGTQPPVDVKIIGEPEEKSAVDELARIIGGFLKDATDLKDAWEDFVEALQTFAGGDSELSQDEAQQFLKKLDDADGDDDKLEDDERNAWQKAGWNPEGDATAKKEKALDELAQIMSGFMKDAADKADAWGDFVEALKKFADGPELSEEEAQDFLAKLDAWDGDDDQLSDQERNDWQTKSWGAKS